MGSQEINLQADASWLTTCDWITQWILIVGINRARHSNFYECILQSIEEFTLVDYFQCLFRLETYLTPSVSPRNYCFMVNLCSLSANSNE